MAVTAKLQVMLTGEQTNALDLGTVRFPFALAPEPLDLTNGTGASQVDKVFTDTRTLAASATEDLDLAAGLTDVFGASITFAKVKAIMITAAAANTNDVQLTRPAANGVPIFLAVSDGFAIKPGGVFVLAWPGTGVTVTAGTGDLLTLTNSAGGTGVTYSIAILGTSA
jgi:hypothetical protein